jgi:hypothetical protein
MSEKDIWLSIQPVVGDEDSVPLTGQSRINQLRVFVSTDAAYTLAKIHQIKTAFGSNLLFSETLTARRGHPLVRKFRNL